ncbi:hypothetical protein, partial [Cedecea sp.]|uniref:hypothetical protein n=1 Tax=Cedecea sp. TaxID=1970739 RepID=UPI002F4095AE
NGGLPLQRSIYFAGSLGSRGNDGDSPETFTDSVVTCEAGLEVNGTLADPSWSIFMAKRRRRQEECRDDGNNPTAKKLL